MADIRKQSSKGREVLLVVYKTSATKDGKGAFVDGLLCDDPHQTNAHLVTTAHKDKDGKTRYSNGQFYTNEQLENLFAPAMASGNFYEEPATDKHSGRLVAKVKADLMPTGNGKGLMINPKTVQPPSNPLDRVQLTGVYENMAIARQLKAEAEAKVIGLGVMASTRATKPSCGVPVMLFSETVSEPSSSLEMRLMGVCSLRGWICP